MDDIRVPITVYSSLPNGIVATPNGGLLYVGGAGGVKVGFIGNIGTDAPVIQHFFAFSTQTIRAIDCDPDWSENQQFAVLTSNHVLHVWDLSAKEPVFGHRALERSASSLSTSAGAMCYLNTKNIMAVDSDRCVIYCVASNTYSVTVGGDLLKSNAVTLLKVCPFDSNLVAAGTKNGLILIAKVSDLSVLHKLRGHDAEITSIDWIEFDTNPPVAERSKKVARSRKPQPIVDSSDIFDIYSYDYLEDEFGTLRDVNPSIEEPKPLIVASNENFDFVEACQNLKEDILRPKNPEDYEDDRSENSELRNETDESGDSDDDVDGNESVRQVDIEDKSDESPKSRCDSNSVLCIATASREPFVWIWDLNSGAALEKIKLKSSLKSSENKMQGLTVRFLDEKTLITNSPNGDLFKFSVSLTDKKLSYATLKDSFKEKLIFNFTLNRKTQQFWAVSLKRLIICTDLLNFDKTLISYSTMAEKLHTIKESPHDMNKIAVAGKTKSIYILDASNFSAQNMSSMVYANHIKAKVICIAWHPENENLLAFSTAEGRVGILDIKKATNVPVTMKPFTSEDVYRISWGLITDASNTTPRWILFASSKTKLVYFPEKDKDPKYLCEDKPISTVSAGKNWLGLGSHDGYIYILTLNGLEIKCSRNISNRYLSEIAWNPANEDILAASSDVPDIHLFDCSNANDGEMKSIGVLKGHCKNGVTMVKWSHSDKYKLLSTGFDGTVRVWNTKTLEAVSIYQSNGSALCATFWPKDENFVICSGFHESLYMFDTRNRMDECMKALKEKPSPVKWGEMEKTDKQKIVSKEKKSNRKTARKDLCGELSKLSESLNKIVLNGKTSDAEQLEPIKNMELTRTTVLYLSHKEFYKNGMEILKELMFERDDQPNYALHRLLFAGKDEAKKLLSIELQNHKDSTTNSVGQLFIPQLNFNLEAEINEYITTKKLTPQHVSLAPMISFSFWRDCCKALANQYLEKKSALLAVPYLLAIHEINDAIKQLLNAHFYREAWIVAKIHKESEDQIFSDIANSWAMFLEEHGNFDCAALVAYSAGKLEMASKMLSKKRTKTECVEKMIEELNKQI
ncbi:Protein rigor mortis, partial [Pseudolycoriella hygida]